MTAGQAELTLAAPAKINLYLAVLGRRADGYHELVTVMQTLDLCDEIVLRVAPRSRAAAGAAAGAGKGAEVSLELARPALGVPTGEENLAVRAAHRLLEQAGATRDVRVEVRLDKRIPAGGGLGGGSSDAAAVLRGLNRLLGEPLDHAALLALAAGLGSDVAFFLTGGTALCTGRGEQVRPIEPPRAVRVTLLLPAFATTTPRVYAAVAAGPSRPAAPDAHELCRAVAGADADALERLFRNDLEQPARRVEPRLAELLDHTHLHLSGSGSTLFGYGEREAQLAGQCEGTSICLARFQPGNP